MSDDHDPSAALLLAVVVEMAPDDVAAGHRYEDAVLALLGRHGGTLERRMRSLDASTEVHVIRFASEDGLASFLADPQRLRLRAAVGDSAPTAHVHRVRDL